MLSRDEADKLFNTSKDRIISELQQYLSFASISSLKEYEHECRACAEWLGEHLSKIGMVTRIISTGSIPVVYAEKFVDPNKPTVVIYGHYDLQPVGDSTLWTHGPFSGVVQDGRIWARGSRDNKGQHFFLIKGIETLIANNSLGCNVKLILDGEEESGSTGLMNIFPDITKEISGDILLACETEGAPNGDPAIIAGLRGAVFTRMRLKGPQKELHSGNHGGRVRNPAIEISKVLGSMFNGSGKIAIAGFYDNVRQPSQKERELANALSFNEESYRKELGVSSLCGEPEFTPVERIGFRPSLEVNGVSSGYTGDGIKTSIPSYADATLSMRLVPNQSPERCIELVRKHVSERLPEGIELEGLESEFLLEPFAADLNSDVIKHATAILDGLATEATRFRWVGASLPIINALVEKGSLSPLLVGFGLAGDNEHGVDESFSLEQFKKGYIFACSYLSSL